MSRSERTIGRFYQRASADVIVTRRERFTLPGGDSVPGADPGAEAARRPLRLVLATDIHARDDWFPASHVARLVEHVNALPDIDAVLLGGDFVGNDAAAIDWAAPLLGELSAPTYAVLGNHDHWTDARRITRALDAAGVTMLTNRSTQLPDGTWLAGVDSCWGGHVDVDAALGSIPSGARTVVLGHEPHLATLHDAALHLAGHTHHGQARLPIPLLGNALTRLYLPRWSYPYPRGRYRRADGAGWVYTSAGVGYSTASFRLTTPPEVVIIEV